MADVTKTLKDATYITIGFGVLAFQRAQVRRRELESRLGEQAEELRSQAEQLLGDTGALRAQLAKVAGEVEGRVEPVVEAWDERLDELEQRLPVQAREALRVARVAAKGAAGQLRSRLLAPLANQAA